MEASTVLEEVAADADCAGERPSPTESTLVIGRRSIATMLADILAASEDMSS